MTENSLQLYWYMFYVQPDIPLYMFELLPVELIIVNYLP